MPNAKSKAHQSENSELKSVEIGSRDFFDAICVLLKKNYNSRGWRVKTVTIRTAYNFCNGKIIVFLPFGADTLYRAGVKI
jgi:hypothetical protein